MINELKLNFESYFEMFNDRNVIEANCPQSSDYSDENKTYNLNGCGDLNVVNSSTYTVENPFNRQNEISIKSVTLDEKIYDSNTEGSATVTFEGKYYKDNLLFVEAYFEDKVIASRNIFCF